MREATRHRVERMKKGVYLLPNLLTSASLLAGFYSIVESLHAEFYYAAVAVLVSTLFDALDGRVARATRTQSAFGVEYDSLADLVSFGVAPGLLVYAWALEPFGRWGFSIAFVYAASTALRLARFNVQVTTVERRFFNGLPSPAAACMLAATVVLVSRPEEAPHQRPLGRMLARGIDAVLARPLDLLFSWEMSILVLTLLVALLMVSGFKYWSFKELDALRRRPFPTLMASVALLALVATEPERMLFLLFAGYALSGPVIWFARGTRKRPAPPGSRAERPRLEVLGSGRGS